MKLANYILGIMIVLAAFLNTSAQNTKLYQFELKQTGDLLTTDSFGTLNMSPKRISESKMAQCFIVNRLGNGRVVIASATNPNHFLKRDGDTVKLTSLVTENDSFEWELVYSGHPYTTLIQPGTEKALGWQQENEVFMQTYSGGLTDNNDSAGDNYRFKLIQVYNTF